MKKLLLLGLIVGLVFGFYWVGEQWLLPETYQALYQEDPVQTAGIFFIVYALVAALSIPGAALMTLISGAIFGLRPTYRILCQLNWRNARFFDVAITFKRLGAE